MTDKTLLRPGDSFPGLYSSGAIGRLVPQDVIGLIRYVRGIQLSRQEAPHGTATA